MCLLVFLENEPLQDEYHHHQHQHQHHHHLVSKISISWKGHLSEIWPAERDEVHTVPRSVRWHHSFLAQIRPSCWSRPSCLATFPPLQTFLASLLDKPCRKQEEKSFNFGIFAPRSLRFWMCALEGMRFCFPATTGALWFQALNDTAVVCRLAPHHRTPARYKMLCRQVLLTETPETLLKDEPAGREKLLFSSEAHASVWLGNVRLKGGWVTKQTVKQLLRSSDSQHFQYLRYLRLAEPFLRCVCVCVCVFLCQCFISASKDVELSCLSALFFLYVMTIRSVHMF